MKNLTDRMETMRTERQKAVRDLAENTTRMRFVAIEAQAAGQSGYEIAKRLGVTTRTVYLWLSDWELIVEGSQE